MPDLDEQLISIIRHLETDDPDQIFLKMRKMNEKDRQVIYERLDEADLEINLLMNRFLEQIFSKLPGNLSQRWSVVNILSRAQSELGGDNQKIAEAISFITGRPITINRQVNWSKYEEPAEKLITARENIYEIKAFATIEQAQVFIDHFCRNFASREKVAQLYDLTYKALKTLVEPEYVNEEMFKAEPEKALERVVIPEFTPEGQKIDYNLVRQAVVAWKLVPRIELERLLAPINREALVDKIRTALTVLRAMILAYIGEKEITDKRVIFLYLRELVKQELKLIDYYEYSS